MSTTHNNYKHGDKVIDTRDAEIMLFFVNYKTGKKYIMNKGKHFWDLNVFEPEDIIIYKGNKQVGEYDYDYLNYLNL